jgi:hypothetical protein
LQPNARYSRVRDELLRRQVVCEAATPGPWEADKGNVRKVEPLGGGGAIGAASVSWEVANGSPKTGQRRKENSAFIAASRSDEPQHLAALLEIVERHKPIEARQPFLTRTLGAFYCGSGDEWPCPDFESIERSLGLTPEAEKP